eukprot:668120-Prorocentrum_minimum.AAC.1
MEQEAEGYRSDLVHDAQFLPQVWEEAGMGRGAPSKVYDQRDVGLPVGWSGNRHLRLPSDY